MVAPERDMDAYQFDDMDARPGYYTKTPSPHPVHLNGMIYRLYVKPNHEVVRIINFLNGHGSPQRYKINKVVDVVAAIERLVSLELLLDSSRDEDGKDSC
jgi:hypothetical protein